MKLPALKTLLLALVSRFGNQSAPTPYVNQPRPFFRPRVEATPKAPRPTGRFSSNQRQARKNRRRANAAGKRNAFA